MPNPFPSQTMTPGWLPGRPLLGVTLLLVEDSRFASEGVRLMCQRLGARIRRADTLAAARRHLGTYLPTVILIDIGLPDGSGLSLIRELAGAQPRIKAILATSGDDGAEAEARAAGADGFLGKPVLRLDLFHDLIMDHLPDEMKQPQVRLPHPDQIHPDRFALRDDMQHAADILAGAEDELPLDYVVQFIGAVAKSARDMPLQRAVESFGRKSATKRASGVARAQLATMLNARIAATDPL